MPTTRAGLVECAECGAAWHPQRWVLAQHDARESRMIMDSFLGTGIPAFSLCRDDRGLPFDVPVPKVRRLRGVSEELRSKITKQLRHAGLRFALRGGGVIAIVWVAANIAFSMSPEWDQYQRSMFAMITALLGAVLVAVCYSMRSNSPGAIRSAVLAQGVCPNCGHPLNGHTPGFDGCVNCVGCGRAWKSTDIGEPAPSRAITPPALRRE